MKSKFNICITKDIFAPLPVVNGEITSAFPTFEYTSFPLEYTVFPGGELHPKIDLEGGEKFVSVSAKIRDAEGIFMLALIKDILDRAGVQKKSLCLGYLPYGRQDRVCNRGEAFSLKVFTRFINSLNFDAVYISDPHSDVSTALLERCTVMSQVECFSQTLGYNDFKGHVLVSPDAGANKKTVEIARLLRHNSFIRADKMRNVSTGQITDTVVYGNVVGKDCLIVDDICDGGATFISLAKTLKFQNAKSVSLYVTHGIFSKGKQHLLDNGIDNIYCYEDWSEE